MVRITGHGVVPRVAFSYIYICARYIAKNGIRSSREIGDFVETPLRKLCVIHGLRVLLGVSSLRIYRPATPRRTSLCQGRHGDVNQFSYVYIYVYRGT